LYGQGQFRAGIRSRREQIPVGQILCGRFKQLTWSSAWRKPTKSHQIGVSPSADAEEESRELVSVPLRSWVSWRRQKLCEQDC